MGVALAAACSDAEYTPAVDAVADRAVVILSHDSATGGHAVELGSGPGGRVSAIAVDAQNVYWTMWGGAGVGDTVMKAPLGCRPASTVVAGQLSRVAIAVDGTSVYFAEACTEVAPQGSIVPA
jgi:hypothetical protein